MVGRGAFAAVVALFNILLGIVPGAAGIGHEDGHEHAGDQGAGQHAAQGIGAQEEAHSQRGNDGHQARYDHLLQSSRGGDIDALGVIRLGGALHDAGHFPELTAHLVDHLVGSLAHRLHGHGGEQEGQHAADEETYDNGGVQEIDGSQLHCLAVGCEEGQSRQGRGTDGKALADGGGGVTHGIQFVGDLADFLGQLAHFRNAAGVVGDGAVGVNRHGDACGGQHAHRRQGDAVETHGVEGQQGGAGDADDGPAGGEHAHCQAADDGGRRAGLGLLCDFLDGFVVSGGVDFRDEADEESCHQTHADGDGCGKVAEHQLAHGHGADDDDGAADIHGQLQGLMGIGVLISLDEQGADDGGGDAQSGEQQRVCHAGLRVGEQDTEGDRRDDGAHIGFEEVSTHAGHVADVVTDVVGDDGGVPGIVFRNTGLHLAHQVSAHVGGLGVDAAAHTAEEGNGGGAQAEACENLGIADEDVQVAHAQEAQAHHAHAHDGAAGEGDFEGLVHAADAGGVSRAHIGLGGHLHAEETGQGRKKSPVDETQCCLQIDSECNYDCEHGYKNNHCAVLAPEKSHGPFLNIGSNFLHAIRPRIHLVDPLRQEQGEQQSTDPQGGGKI